MRQSIVKGIGLRSKYWVVRLSTSGLPRDSVSVRELRSLTLRTPKRCVPTSNHGIDS